ncbi:hypothetical protein ACROYT_G039331 [Oculina patagonica]
MVRDQSCACNSAAHAGVLKYSNGTLYICMGSKWKAVRLIGDYGTEFNPGLSCKDILNKAGQQLSNGVFWIHLQGSPDSFPAYCDMDSGGWTLVFKVVSGVDKKVWDLYNSDQASAEYEKAALDVTNQHHDHYKNRVVMNWQTFNASQAKVILYEGAVAKKKLVFDASGTDKLNWFSVDKLTNSPWTDVKTEQRNFFSIQGGCDGGNCRSFFINRNYGGCDVDAGWLVTSGGPWCSWETSASRKNKVLYSKLSTYTNWNNNANGPVANCLARSVGISDQAIIPDNHMNASSQYRVGYQAAYGRLNGNRGDGWCAKEANRTDDWLLVDLGRTFKVCALATQGDINGNEWVTDFKLSYWSDGNVWTTYKDANGVEVEFHRQGDSNTVDQHILSVPVHARYFRFHPTKQNGWNCLRVELYGEPSKGYVAVADVLAVFVI